jgi:predicted RNA-binding protein with PIN domain
VAQSSNDIFRNSQVDRVRDLKNKIAVITRERDESLSEIASLKAHFALALVAAQDIAKLPDGGKIVIVDGWNAVFDKLRRVNDGDEGEKKEARAKETLRRRTLLVETVKSYAAENENVFVWLVFDGNDAAAEVGDRWRISYTGGKGSHRADRMICDFVRMIGLAGLKADVTVMTNDRDFRKEVQAAGANVAEANALCKRKESKNSPEIS